MEPRGSADVLPTHTPALFERAVRQAATCLCAGELVALPTETVYGLAANALDAQAVAKVFSTKGRPASNPIIVHVASLEMARRCVAAWPDLANRLATAFWPGPLTLVLSRASCIPAIVTAGGPTVGVRWPSHPFMQAVIRACGFPLAAPSANAASQLSPTSAEHVVSGLGDRIRLIVDGGPAQVGIESTVVDLTKDPPQVLRPGMIHAESLRAVTGKLAAPDEERGGSGPLRSPGQLPRHYAPKARLMIWSWSSEEELKARLAHSGWDLAQGQVVAHTVIPTGGGFGRVSVIPHDAEAFARALYAELHRCDEAGAEWIVVEAVPNSPAWQAIGDRLARAATL
jgi:L-threonylcarbamoyladenylate synthase